jgi:hypothetical protein
LKFWLSLLTVALVVASVAAFGPTSAGVASAHATCEGLGGIEVHGQHIVGDYVTGLGGIGGGIDWPPAGEVGDAIGGDGGAVLPGGPGPGFHFPNDVPPGASFCNEQAHPDGFTVPEHFSS